jgi:two-component system response regulator HydG
MRPRSLKGKLLVAVSAFVAVSGLVIALLMSQRYSSSLRLAMLGQAENVAQAVALEAADKILINDLVGLQKLLEQQMHSHSAIGYLFVVRDGQVLAHTFGQGMPAALLQVNDSISSQETRFQKIASATGEHYLDTAWPIFDGKAGVLRLGFSEDYYRRQISGLWLEMGLITLGILLLALVGSLAFVRRITRPLAALVEATQRIDQGNSDVRVPITGQDEIAALAASFNQMVSRQEEYTRKLEVQAHELERAHVQTKAACSIVREVSALQTLEEVGGFLLDRLKDITGCPHPALLAFNTSHDSLFFLSNQSKETCTDAGAVKAVRHILAKIKNPTIVDRPLDLPVYREFPANTRQAVIPFDAGQLNGAVFFSCAAGCACSPEKLEWVRLILTHNAGALRRAILHEEVIGDLKSRVEAAQGFGEIIGKDPKMQVVYKLIEDVAPSDATVLIQGESGTGKELAARAIHRLSPRREKPFVVINCSAYPATLLESELFGHEKGAFTGATRQKPGRFEQANGGTVFLDEVGEISSPAQIKLLRVLQTRKFERVGGERTLTVDVRILAATNKDLRREVEQGNFREDLFYRLNVIPLLLPPLRNRRNDIPMLASHFLKRFASEQGKNLKGFSSEAMRLLLECPWPGNVRELENTVEHAVVLAKGSEIEAWELPSALGQGSTAGAHTLAEKEIRHLLEILNECGGNKKLAAQRLGVSRSTVYAMLKRHNMTSKLDN